METDFIIKLGESDAENIQLSNSYMYNAMVIWGLA